MSTCADCGMVLREPGEYHPMAACLMFKGCHDGDMVRANLPAPSAVVEALVEDALHGYSEDFAAQKAHAYGQEIMRVWAVLSKAGRPADGNTRLADAVTTALETAEHAAARLREALAEIADYNDEAGGPPPDDAMRSIASSALSEVAAGNELVCDRWASMSVEERAAARAALAESATTGKEPG